MLFLPSDWSCLGIRTILSLSCSLFSTQLHDMGFTETAASIGFTRRAGNTRLVHSSLSQLLQMFPHTLPNPGAQATHSQSAAKGKIALVFGREESGLTESELSLCTHSCSIPTGTLQPSLNLSHAVCVILAQLYEQRDSSCNTGEHSALHITHLLHASNPVKLSKMCSSVPIVLLLVLVAHPASTQDQVIGTGLHLLWPCVSCDNMHPGSLPYMQGCLPLCQCCFTVAYCHRSYR